MGRLGYRLYTVRVHRGRAHKITNLAECEGAHYQDRIAPLLEKLQTISIGNPDLNTKADESDGDEEETSLIGKRAFRIEKFRRADRAIFGSLYAGRFGDYQLAMSATDEEDDASLEGLAASRSYRFVLVLPEIGEYGILALETIDLTCPIGQLTGWVSATSKRNSEAATDGDAEAQPPWWYFKAQQMTDVEQLRDLVQSSRLSKVDLVQYDQTPDRIRRREKLRVTAPYIEGSAASVVADALRAWWEQKQAEEERAPDETVVPVTTDEEGANQLSVILGKDIENVHFDDGWVVLKDPADKTRRVSPSRMSELFTYTLSWDVPVSDETFYRKVRDRAQRLAANSQVSVEWPSVRSVVGDE